MWLVVLILSLVTLQRLTEFAIARRNTRRLLDRGGVDLGTSHHGLVVALHAVWLVGLWYLVLYRQTAAADMAWIYGYAVLEAARGWIVAAFGSRWTTRLIAIPGEALPDEGPASWFRHANSIVVAVEIVLLPLAFGLWWYAIAFGVLNVALLAWRIRAEDKALRPLRADAQSTAP